jgi:hypothetical protein
MRFMTVLAAAAALAIPLAGGARADDSDGAPSRRHGNSHHASRHHESGHYGRHYHGRHRSPRVAGFRFSGGGHANGYQYESYARFNYEQSKQWPGFFGYGPTFDNRSFAETVMGGGIRFGGDRP